jgi:hypothetical protein
MEKIAVNLSSIRASGGGFVGRRFPFSSSYFTILARSLARLTDFCTNTAATTTTNWRRIGGKCGSLGFHCRFREGRRLILLLVVSRQGWPDRECQSFQRSSSSSIGGSGRTRRRRHLTASTFGMTPSTTAGRGDIALSSSAGRGNGASTRCGAGTGRG